MLHERIKANFLSILKEELIPAMGCTEPIALAYASAKAREILGGDPDRIVAKCSGNIIICNGLGSGTLKGRIGIYTKFANQVKSKFTNLGFALNGVACIFKSYNGLGAEKRFKAF